MTQHKRKKVVKYRGSKTHGGGSMKKRRGAGHRGGRGNAGSGKRGDSRKPSYWKLESFGRGKTGFVAVMENDVETMNVSDLSKDLDLLVEAGHAKKSGSAYTVDLDAAGVEKLLGNGRISVAVKVTVGKASAKAVEKIEAAGGSVTLAEEEAPVKAPAKKSTKKAAEAEDEQE